MRYIPLKTAALAIVCIAASVLSARAESLAIRNCTWCHGSSAQGYTPAPRLAGQRALTWRTSWQASALMRGIIRFRNSICGARQQASVLSLCASWQFIFLRSAPTPPMTATMNSPRSEEPSINRVFRTRTLRPRRVSRTECRGRRRNSSFGRSGLHLPETAPATMGRGLPCDRPAADATYCEQAFARPDRGAGVVPQLRQVNPNMRLPRDQRQGSTDFRRRLRHLEMLRGISAVFNRRRSL